jgi:hypothetical protein
VVAKLTKLVDDLQQLGLADLGQGLAPGRAVD